MAQYGATIASLGGSFLIAPVFLDRLGLTAFGVWAITGALAQYASVLDLGITRSLARFVAVYARDDSARVSSVLGLGMISTAVLTVAIGVVAWAGTGAVRALLHNSISYNSLRSVLLASVLLFVVGLLTRVLAAIPTGFEDLVTPSIAAGITALLNLVVSVVVLLNTKSLAVYAWASAMAGVAGVLITGALIKRAGHGLRVAMPDKLLVREVGAYALKGQVPWIADLINFQSDKVVLSAIVDVRAAASYELVNRVVSAARMLAASVQSALLPRAVAMIGASSGEAAKKFADNYTRIFARIAWPTFLGLCVAGPSLLVGWLGKLPHDGIVILIGLSIAYVANVLPAALGSFAAADGTQMLFVVPAIVTSIVNIGLTAGLGIPFGVVGVLAGTVAAFAAGSLLAAILYCRRYGIGLSRYASASTDGLLVSILVTAMFGAVATIIGVPSSRWIALVLSIVLYAPFMVSCAIGLGPLAQRRARRADTDVDASRVSDD